MKISIIVLSYNGGKDLIECLTSLSKIPARVIVVDNHSQDKSFDKAQKLFKKYLYIRNNKNLGFAGGNNIGIKLALDEGTDGVMLLNQDTVVYPNFLKPLTDLLFSRENIGIVSPVIRFGKLIDTGAKEHWLWKTAVHQNVKRLKDNSPIQRDFVTGCCMLIKRSVFEKAGLLNEKYFLYFEDDDFCHKARRAGYSIWVNPLSQIYHKLSRSFGVFSSQTIYYNIRSGLIFAKQNLSFLIFIIFYIDSWMRCIYFLIKKPKVGLAGITAIINFNKK